MSHTYTIISLKRNLNTHSIINYNITHTHVCMRINTLSLSIKCVCIESVTALFGSSLVTILFLALHYVFCIFSSVIQSVLFPLLLLFSWEVFVSFLFQLLNDSN